MLYNKRLVRSRIIPRQVTWAVGFLLLLGGCVLWHNWVYPALIDEDYIYFRWPPEGSVTPSNGVYVDWKDYQPILLPKCDNEPLANRTLLIIVKSAADRAQSAHSALRSPVLLSSSPVLSSQMPAAPAWRQQRHLSTLFAYGRPGASVHTSFCTMSHEPELPPRVFYGTVFAVGCLNDTNQDLQEEHKTYGDLAVGNFVDSYHANTKKFLLQIKLASNYCGLGSALPYVFLVDDDHFVIVGNLLEEALKHSPKEPLYMGWAQMSAPPMRYVWDKNYVSVSDYPYEQYPPFVSGGAVLLSQGTIQLYYSGIPRIKPFKWEDVYAGIIARILGIKTLHNPNFRFKATGADDPAMLAGIASHGYRLGEA